MSRTVNSSTIPSFLVQALGNIRKSQTTEVEPAKPAVAVRIASLDCLPIEAIQERKLIAHGAGVYEDPSSKTIWYKEGQFLKRRAQDIDRLINDYVASIK